jgi:hypothetical protein
MEKNIVKIEFEKNEWHYLIPIGDIHLGNKGCDIQRLKELIAWIKEKENCMWIGTGDYCDFIAYTDPRFDPSTVSKRYLDNLGNCVQMQIHDIIDLFEPIAYKCIGFHRGNHEEKIRLKYHHDVMYELCKAFDFKIPNLKDTAITRLKFIRNCNATGKKPHYTFDIFSQHGRVGGRKGGNKINWLEDLIGYVKADVYIIAHSHIKATELKTQLYLDSHLNLKQRKKVLAVTGSFLRGYNEGHSSYIEKWMLPPTDLGVIKLMFNPREKDIHVSI